MKTIGLFLCLYILLNSFEIDLKEWPFFMLKHLQLKASIFFLDYLMEEHHPI